MSLLEQIQAHAQLMAGGLSPQQTEVLKTLCQAAASYLENRLREGLTAEDCKADFVAAASLLALAGLNSYRAEDFSEQVSVADFTMKTTTGYKDAASNCLKTQAELMIAPYQKDRFAFLGV